MDLWQYMFSKAYVHIFSRAGNTALFPQRPKKPPATRRFFHNNNVFSAPSKIFTFSQFFLGGITSVFVFSSEFKAFA